LKCIALFGKVAQFLCLCMPDSFGSRLRQQRERQQITLSSIAEQTKIKVSLLEGLERDDVSYWPVGIFRRAFVRSYAHAIGLDPGPVLVEFLARYPDPTDVVAAPETTATTDDAREVARPPTRLRFLVGSAISSLSRGRDATMNKPKAPEDAATDSASVAPPIEVTPLPVPTPFEPDLVAAAQLCTELSRAENTSEMAPLLSQAARILDAIGVIVWVSDTQGAELRPALAHGYSDKLLGQLPTVKRDADNATAAAFRSGQMSVVDGIDGASGALAVPLMAPGGCVGVLAIEVQNRSEQIGSVRAVVTIFAAQLASWIHAGRPAELSDRRLA
jgi:transcriptional regulator with XRE-family HTH domain